MSVADHKRYPPVDLLPSSKTELEVGPVEELPPGKVTGTGNYAVGNPGSEYFAVTRSCRHLLGDLAKGTIDKKGCLVCPLHGSRYDVKTGRMVSGPNGIYAKVPGLGAAFKALTRIIPLGRGKVVERGGKLYVS